MGKRNMFAAIKNNKVLGALILCTLITLSSGCTLSEKSVKLHTEKEMQKHVEELYGSAELISVEQTEEPYRKVFTYRDTDYGFTYQMVSRPNSVGMDGSTFYYDGASVNSDYTEEFLKYFNKTEKDRFAKQGITLSDNLKYSNYYTDNRMYSLRDGILISTEDHWEDDMKFVWERVHSYKDVQLFGQHEMDIKDSINIEFLGTLKEDGFVSAEQQRIETYMYQARQLAGIQNIKYVRTEEKNIKDIPELADQEFYDERLRDGDGKVHVYYFTYEGKEYFIIDEWVAQIGDNGGGIFQYYQNYKHYDVSR